MVNNPPAVKETQVSSLGQESPLEEEMITHSSGECHGQRSLVGYSSWGLKEVQHNLATKQNKTKKICCYSGNDQCMISTWSVHVPSCDQCMIASRSVHDQPRDQGKIAK